MQIHELKPIHKKRTRKRVGRGGKRGTYSGRGMKGQKSRAGRRLVPSIRGLIKRYPKLRGYGFKPQSGRIAVLNIEVLEKNFKANEKITPDLLLKQGLIRRIEGRTPTVKILGKGKIAKSLSLEGFKISKKAKEAVEKAGGSVK